MSEVHKWAMSNNELTLAIFKSCLLSQHSSRLFESLNNHATLFFFFFVHIPRSHGGSLGSSCLGCFPPIGWCYGGLLHLVISDRTPIMRFSSLGGLQPLRNVMVDSFICWFWEDSSHFFLLFRMTHYVMVDSFISWFWEDSSHFFLLFRMTNLN